MPTTLRDISEPEFASNAERMTPCTKKQRQPRSPITSFLPQVTSLSGQPFTAIMMPYKEGDGWGIPSSFAIQASLQSQTMLVESTYSLEAK